jgi:hypothetical protein
MPLRYPWMELDYFRQLHMPRKIEMTKQARNLSEMIGRPSYNDIMHAERV